MALLGAQFVNAVSPNPVGSLQAYAGASAPTGWLLCDGTSYSTSVYPELYSVLGYTYGGSGANFNVPDLRGRVPMGAGTGTGLNASGTGAPSGTAQTARTLGQWGGEETHLLTGAESGVAAHNHGITDPGHSHFLNESPYNGTGNSIAVGANPSAFINNSQTNSATTGITVNNATAANASSRHNVVPPFVVTTYIIKAVSDAPRSGLAYGSTPPIVTALPSNPQFGDVVTYIADAANGVAWNLQYDASGTYPWKFIGGSGLASLTGVTEATTSTSYVALATAGPVITLPLAGDYDVTVLCDAAHTSGTTYAGIMSYDVGATAANDVWGAWSLVIGPGYGDTTTYTYRHVGLAASTTLTSKYRSPQAAQIYFGRRRLSATPSE